MPVSQRQFARAAGVSQPAVSQALRTGLLTLDDDRRLDPDHPTNAHYLGMHAAGLDHREHAIRPEAITGNGAAPPAPEAAPPASSNGAAPAADAEPPDDPEPAAAASPLFSDWAAQPVDVAKADALLKIVGDGGEAAPLLCAMLEALRAAAAGELAALGKRLDAIERDLAATRHHSARMFEAVASLLDIKL